MMVRYDLKLNVAAHCYNSCFEISQPNPGACGKGCFIAAKVVVVVLYSQCCNGQYKKKINSTENCVDSNDLLYKLICSKFYLSND